MTGRPHATVDGTEDNPYGAPAAAVAEVVHDGHLAGRGERVAAVLLDGLLAMVIVMPMMYFGGYMAAVTAAAAAGRQVPLTTQLGWGLFGFAVFVLLQGYPLARSGQTWGKRALGIRIVRLDGRRATLWHLLIRRYLPMQAITMIPVVGGLAAMVNALLVFRADKRCGHDLVAGTQVVRCR